MTFLAPGRVTVQPRLAYVPRLYPPAGNDTFGSTAVIDATLGAMPLPAIILTGPTTIMRGNPVTLPSGLTEIPTEMVALQLTGTTRLCSQPVVVTLNSTMRSTGLIVQETPGVDFPARSFFDVFVELSICGMVLHNDTPINMSAIINAIPPKPANVLNTGGVDCECYKTLASFTLLEDTTGRTVAAILAEYHMTGDSSIPVGILPSSTAPCLIYTINGVLAKSPFCNTNSTDIKIDFNPGAACGIQWTHFGSVLSSQPCPTVANDTEVFWMVSKTGVPVIASCTWTLNEKRLSPCPVPAGANDFEFSDTAGLVQVFWTIKGKLVIPHILAPPGTNDVEFFF